MIKLVVLVFFTFGVSASIQAPKAKRFPVIDDFHNDIRVDNYKWMEDKESPEVLKHLQNENAYTKKVLANSEILREELINESKKFRAGAVTKYVYFSTNYKYYKVRNQDEARWRWYKASIKNNETPILFFDENKAAGDSKSFDVYSMSIAPDESKAFFVIDDNGRWRGKPAMVDLKTNKFVRLEDHGLLYPVELSGRQILQWIDVNQILFLASTTEMGEFNAYVYNIEEQSSTLVFEFPNKDFHKSVLKTNNGADILLESQGTTDTRHYQYHSQDSNVELLYETVGSESSLYRHKNEEFMVKDRNTLLRKMESGTWQMIYATSNRSIKSIQFFDEYAVILFLNQVSNKLGILNLETLELKEINGLNEPIAISGVFLKREWENIRLTFGVEERISPLKYYTCDLRNCNPEGSKQLSEYDSRKIYVTARDGEDVPVTLFYKKGQLLKRNNIVKLIGYGSYGHTILPWYDNTVMPLLDRGVIYAVAHLRGGGAKGKAWHDDGRYFNKMNTFTDFIDVSEGLIDQEITSKDKLVIMGRSAGGLLMGAVLNMRPDLFRAAAVVVPFVDVLNTMTHYYDPLAKYEKKEWGDGLIEEEYYLIKSYDPYTNIATQSYPSIYVATGFEDTAVYYFQPMKWVAKMREYNPNSSNPLVFRTNFGAGHIGSGADVRDSDMAHENAFLLSEVINDHK